ncbi:hypothetical protein ACCQ23_00660 [Xanthomonas axonopodis pv. phyllanthi]|uniref:hypothetical protein n=1 Tax=Xanthomonas axonopodis TaxID=53413 RepID=UPI0035588A6C
MQEVILALGGYTVVLGGLFAFLGRVWLLRIVEKEKFELQRQLDETNRKLQAELDRDLHVSKTQFDAEFANYKSIWACLVDFRASTLQLRPMLDFIDPNESKEDRLKRRLTTFQSNFNTLRDQVEKNKPFYAQSVYDKLSEVIRQCHSEAIDAEYQERPSREYWKEADKNRKEIASAIDETCESIRTRVSSVRVEG